jgi:chromosome segregation ATPase
VEQRLSFSGAPLSLSEVTTTSGNNLVVTPGARKSLNEGLDRLRILLVSHAGESALPPVGPITTDELVTLVGSAEGIVGGLAEKAHQAEERASQAEEASQALARELGILRSSAQGLQSEAEEASRLRAELMDAQDQLRAAAAEAAAKERRAAEALQGAREDHARALADAESSGARAKRDAAEALSRCERLSVELIETKTALSSEKAARAALAQDFKDAEERHAAALAKRLRDAEDAGRREAALKDDLIRTARAHDEATAQLARVTEEQTELSRVLRSGQERIAALKAELSVSRARSSPSKPSSSSSSSSPYRLVSATAAAKVASPPRIQVEALVRARVEDLETALRDANHGGVSPGHSLSVGMRVHEVTRQLRSVVLSGAGAGAAAALAAPPLLSHSSLEGHLIDLASAAEEVTREVAAARRAAQRAEAEEKALRAESDAMQSDLHARSEENRDLRERLADAQAELASHSSRAAELRAAAQASRLERDEAARRAERLAAELADCHRDLASAQEQLAGARRASSSFAAEAELRVRELTERGSPPRKEPRESKDFASSSPSRQALLEERLLAQAQQLELAQRKEEMARDRSEETAARLEAAIRDLSAQVEESKVDALRAAQERDLARSELARTRGALEVAEQRASLLDGDLALAREAAAKAERGLQDARAQAAAQQQGRQAAEARGGQVEADLASAKRALAEADRAAQELRQELIAVRSEQTRSLSALSQHELELAVLREEAQRLREVQIAAEQYRRGEEAAVAERNGLRAEREAQKVELTGLIAAQRRLGDDVAQLSAKLDQARREADSATAERNSLRAEREAQKVEVAGLMASQRRLSDDVAQLSAMLDQARREAEAATSERNSLRAERDAQRAEIGVLAATQQRLSDDVSQLSSKLDQARSAEMELRVAASRAEDRAKDVGRLLAESEKQRAHHEAAARHAESAAEVLRGELGSARQAHANTVASLARHKEDAERAEKALLDRYRTEYSIGDLSAYHYKSRAEELEALLGEVEARHGLERTLVDKMLHHHTPGPLASSYLATPPKRFSPTPIPKERDSFTLSEARRRQQQREDKERFERLLNSAVGTPASSSKRN